MSAFKDQLARDVMTTFLNVDEFADVHNVNGKDMPVLIDGNEMQEREIRFSQHLDGAYANDLLMYVSAEKMGDMPTRGEALTLDGETYVVVDSVDEYGVYAITISQTTPMGKGGYFGLPR